MADDKIINKIIKRKCKEIFPKDVFQKGTSRVYYDDNGYYLTHIEFQPYSLKRGTFLNAMLDYHFFVVKVKIYFMTFLMIMK